MKPLVLTLLKVDYLILLEYRGWGGVCVCERERGHVSTFRIYNIVVSVSLIEKVMFM